MRAYRRCPTRRAVRLAGIPAATRDFYLTHPTDQSPVDPTLYYKRATAYYSLGRHDNALSDFDQVLALTSDSFDKAHLMKAKIHAKEGSWADAREALKHYQAKNDPVARELLLDVADAEAAARKAAQAQKAKLWTACEESATQGLRVASHSVALRQQRANCALAAGDFEEAVGDLRFVPVVFAFSSVLTLRLQPTHSNHGTVNRRVHEHISHIILLHGVYRDNYCNGEPQTMFTLRPRLKAMSLGTSSGQVPRKTIQEAR